MLQFCNIIRMYTLQFCSIIRMHALQFCNIIRMYTLHRIHALLLPTCLLAFVYPWALNW